MPGATRVLGIIQALAPLPTSLPSAAAEVRAGKLRLQIQVAAVRQAQSQPVVRPLVPPGVPRVAVRVARELWELEPESEEVRVRAGHRERTEQKVDPLIWQQAAAVPEGALAPQRLL